jgi:hypothetical protein
LSGSLSRLPSLRGRTPGSEFSEGWLTELFSASNLGAMRSLTARPAIGSVAWAALHRHAVMD